LQLFRVKKNEQTLSTRMVQHTDSALIPSYN
jgi:hypothetical protein